MTNLQNSAKTSVEQQVRTLWYLYVVRTADDTLYTGVATDVERRFKEHCSPSKRGAKYFNLHPAAAIAFAAAIGSRGMASKVEYWFKQLSRQAKEVVIKKGQFRYDGETGQILES